MPRDPAYSRLAEDLAADMATGRYALGERLPTEAQLCASTGLSRGTVRQALAQLERLGMISRRAGDGSRVLATFPVADYQPVAGSADDIMTLVRTTRIDRPRVREVIADRALAQRLAVPTASRWQLIEGPRVPRDHPSAPLCWSEQYVRPDPDVVQRVVRARFTVADAAAVETEQIVTAEPLAPEVAVLLETSSTVALVIMRRHRDSHGRILSVGVHTHPGDRYALRSVIAPRTSPPVTPDR